MSEYDSGRKAGAKWFLEDVQLILDTGELPAEARRLRAAGELALRKPVSPWLPADPDGLPPESYPMWRRQEMARREGQ